MTDMKRFLRTHLLGANFTTKTVRAILGYSTPVKLINFALCEAERLSRTRRPHSKPHLAIVDITNICNLRCYHCPTGKRLYGRKPGVMDTSCIEEFLRELGRYLYTAYLFSWGEPLLHPEAAKIVHMFHSQRILTAISTNLNIGNKGLLEDICDAGLDYLDLSIDGATQEVYSQYRVGGDLELVLENIRHVVEYKHKMGLRTPVVEWQFLIFDHNRHEVEAAREMAEGLGVDKFKAAPGIIPDKFGEAWRGYRECPFLWNSVGLQVDGGVSPCCNLIDKSDDFGDLGVRPFEEIWRGQRYELARSLFSPKWAAELPPDLEHPCLGCSLVRIQPHLADFLKHNIHIHAADTTSTHTDDTIAVRSGEKGS